MNETALPPSWEWATMGAIAEVIGGGTPATSDALNFDGGNIPWITPADLTGYTEKYISHGARFITAKGLINSGARMMPKGAVLFSSRAPIGYVAVTNNSVCTNQGFKSFVLAGGLEPEYVYYYLKSAKNIAISLASGTTFLEISGAKAATIPVPVAPPSEQERIVAEIERQFSLLDVGIANLKRVQANLKRYRASVLQAACEGRLVPTEAELARTEGRDYEPADVLLTRILAERRERWEAEQLAKMEAQGKLPLNGAWKAKYQEPAALDVRELPELPEGWVWTSAEQACEFITKGTTPSSDDMSADFGEVPYIKVYNLTNIGILDFSIKPTFISLKIHEQDLARSRVYPGDVLMNIVGPPLGKISITPNTYPEWNINQAIVFFRPVNGLYGKFLVYTLLTESILSRVTVKAKATAGQSNLTLELCRSLPLPLPPQAEQKRIVTEVERHLSVVDQIEQVVKANLKRAERLRQSILKEAFAGRLVPQDSNDEPASILLERIQAEREANRNVGQPSRRKPKQGAISSQTSLELV